MDPPPAPRPPKFEPVDLELADLVRPSLSREHPWFPDRPWRAARPKLARWAYELRELDEIAPDRIRAVFAVWGRLPQNVRKWPETFVKGRGRGPGWESVETASRALRGARDPTRGSARPSGGDMFDGREHAL